MNTKIFTICLAAFMVFGLGVSTFAGTTVGGLVEKDFTDDSILYGGYLRTGGLFKLELGGTRSYTSSSSQIKLFSYFLVNLNLGSIGLNSGSLDFYFGASPDMTLDTSTPSFSLSNSSAYGKVGLELKIFPFSVQLESKSRFELSGNFTNLLGGLGVGLTF